MATCKTISLTAILCWTVLSTVNTAPSSELTIVHPSGDKVKVAQSEALTLMCRGGAAGGVRWLHKGVPLTSDGRVTIADTPPSGGADVWQSTLTVDDVTAADAGLYRCEEVDNIFNVDSIEVIVSLSKEISIVDVPGHKLAVTANSTFSIKCSFARFLTVQWVHNGTVLDTDSGERIATERVDEETGASESWVLIEDADYRDLGTYWCQNKNDPAMGDYVIVALRTEDSPSEQTLHVAMKVNSDLTLTCDEAVGSVFSWSKNGQQLTTNNKYLVVTDQLTIVSTDKTDAGQYQCSSYSHDGGPVKDTMTFNLSIVACVPFSSAIILSANDTIECPTTPLYGDYCIHRSDGGITRKWMCDLRPGGSAAWTGAASHLYAERVLFVLALLTLAAFSH